LSWDLILRLVSPVFRLNPGMILNRENNGGSEIHIRGNKERADA